MPPRDLVIAPLRLPATVDAPDGADFRELAALTRVVMSDVWGSHDFDQSDATCLASWRGGPGERTTVLVARTGGRIVGWATVAEELEQNGHLVWLNVRVAPDHRRQGIGTALAAAIEPIARATGRSTATTFSFIDPRTDGVGEPIVPASGAGRLFSADPGAAFALRHGFTLAMVNRASVLRVAEAAPGAGAPSGIADGYDLVAWTGPTPPEHAVDVAALYTAIDDDAPRGELDLETRAWTVERLAAADARMIESRRAAHVTAARHRASGRLVAFTVLVTDADAAVTAEQDETVVLAEHRGHGVGLAIKRANLARVREAHPELERVYTWNASENAPMLAINTAMGFVPAGGSGSWQRGL